MINDYELKKMNQDYCQLYEEYGDNERSLGWNKPKQRHRYDILFKMITKRSQLLFKKDIKLLDIGCGLAHFLSYLNEKKFTGIYLGVDANKIFVEKCRKKFPQNQFFCEIVSDYYYNADIIVASGIFNRKFEASKNLIQDFIIGASKSKAKVILANFLHSAARKKNHKNFYTAIADIEPFIDRNIIAGFEIDALTLPGEFTLGLYK